MKINKDELLKALEMVKPGLANKEIIEQSTSFAFMGDRIVTYNDEISISHPIKGMEITGAVKADQLYQFLGKVKKDEIDIEVTENELILSSGKARAGITLQSEIILPLDEMGKISKWKKLDEEFFIALFFVSEAASNDMSKPILTNIHCQDDLVEASDGFQIIRHKLKNKLPNEFLLPKHTISNLFKFKPTKIAISHNWLHFKTEENLVFSCRTFNDSYPIIDPHLKVTGKTITFPRTIAQILDRAQIFAKRDHYMDEVVEIILSANTLIIKGKNEYGWFEEEANIKYNDDAIVFYITPILLKNIIKVSSTCIVGENKIKFEGENWEFISLLKIKN